MSASTINSWIFNDDGKKKIKMLQIDLVDEIHEAEASGVGHRIKGLGHNLDRVKFLFLNIFGFIKGLNFRMVTKESKFV